jgi:hypothetical protein
MINLEFSIPCRPVLDAAGLRRESGVRRETAHGKMNEDSLPIYRFGAKGRNISFARRCKKRIVEVWTVAESHEPIVEFHGDLAKYTEGRA